MTVAFCSGTARRVDPEGLHPSPPAKLTIDRIPLPAEEFRPHLACSRRMRIRTWAESSFGHAHLGDMRRTRRLVSMAENVARRPGGRVTDVFRTGATRQAAYDFLEHDSVSADEVGKAMFTATAGSVRDLDRVLVAVDGSSLNLTEGADKGFGSIGTISCGARGLKVMSALALSEDGVSIGLVDQVWWARTERAKARGYRPADQRESAYWRAVVANVTARFAQHAPSTRAHFLFDREGDAALLLQAVVASGHEFTCRAKPNRKVVIGGRRCDVRQQLRGLRALATMTVDLPTTPKRRGRLATLDVWAARLPVVMRDNHLHNRRVVPLTVVWVRERGRSLSRGGLDWFLYTNVGVSSAADARAVVARYTRRWRIEEFHRAWKSGVCRTEETQLRSRTAVIKWATILAAVATRAERLRLLARESPADPASVEFTDDEILALVTLRSEARPRDKVSSEGLTVGLAVRWIADLGGYVGTKSSGPPGTVTISRGLDSLLVAAAVIEKLRAAGRLR